ERSGGDLTTRAAGAAPGRPACHSLALPRSDGRDGVLVDTAGRLQNKTDPVAELLRAIPVLTKPEPDPPHEPLLVLDPTVGRHALAQEQIFGRTAYGPGLVMPKLDGTARGGVLVPVAQASDAPITLIGVGEGIDDLQPFDAQAFAGSLVGLEAEDA